MGEPLKLVFSFLTLTQIPCQTTAKMKETHLSWSRGRVHCCIMSPLGSSSPVLLLGFLSHVDDDFKTRQNTNPM